MTRSKLERYRENRESDYVLEHTEFGRDGKSRPIGEWNRLFGREGPLILELACGRGEYSLALAEKAPDSNIIGIDIKGARLWKGARKVREKGFQNVRFLRIYIEHLTDYFEEGEVTEIWITFPDPFPKQRQAKKRLTSPRFLRLYRKILASTGTVHLKTDNQSLVRYTIESLDQERWELLKKLDNVDMEKPDNPLLNVQTRFEKKHRFRGATITYLKFRPRCF